MTEVPQVVRNNSGHGSCVDRQSATIVADNRLALAPSLAVEYSRVFPILAIAWFIITEVLKVALVIVVNGCTQR